MARTFTRSQKAFFFTVAVTMAMAFMPLNWLWWLNDVAKVVTLPITPVGQVGIATSHWLRPSADPRLRPADTQRERLLQSQLDELERLYQAADLRARELQEQLEQIQMMPLDDARVSIRPIIASITGRNPRNVTAKVQINRGQRFGVEDGAIAAYGGVHLIGRVTEAGAVRSHLLPITNLNSDYIRARVVPRDQPEMSITAAPVIDLAPRGDGAFTADVEHTVSVAVGDIVRLDDRRWPASAQAMVVGFVEQVRPNDSNSLLKSLLIRPRFHANELANVTLKIEVGPGDASGDFGGGGGG
jgi:hypothetical protein